MIIMTKKVALVILGFGWCLAIMIAIIPLIWNRWDTAMECEFDELLHPWYVAGVITPIFSLVWLCLLLVYWRIWREAAKHAKQLRAHHSQEGTSDWKSVQVVLLIMGCFTICWLPYFVVILTQIFNFFDYNSPVLYKAVFSLAMANSMMNPVIYAWKNTNFRDAFKQLLTCRKLDQLDGPQTGTGPRSRSSRKRDSSRSNHDSGNPSSRVRPISQDSVESIAAQMSDHEITFISTLHDPDSIQNHTIQLSVGATNRGSGTNGPTSFTTHIIKGNVIINNYNLYESYLNVRNENDRKSGTNVSSRSSSNGTETNGNQAKDNSHNCDMKEAEGISNPSFAEDVTRL